MVGLLIAGGLGLIGILVLAVTARTNKIVNLIMVVCGILVPTALIGFFGNAVLMGGALVGYEAMNFAEIMDEVIGNPVWLTIVLIIVDLFSLLCLIFIPGEAQTDVYNILGEKLGTKGGSWGLTGTAFFTSCYLMLLLFSLFV
ncbi:MAG: hypothetical protein J6S04_06885 [Clostridia bacterium]|nr:hypothetical protein [Clostridia bacterium]